MKRYLCHFRILFSFLFHREYLVSYLILNNTTGDITEIRTAYPSRAHFCSFFVFLSFYILFFNVWRKSVFDIYFTEFGTALTTILSILFQYCYKYCYSDSRNESERFGALISDSTHHFIRNACTKSGSLQYSQFSGCWLILSVYIIMSFDFPFVRLFGVR